MRYAWAAIAIVGVLAAAVGVSGGYFIFNLQNTQSQLEEAKGQARTLQKQVESLQEKEKTLTAERNSIEARIVTIVDKLDVVNLSLNSNKKENQDLKMHVSDLEMQLQGVAAGLGVRIEEIKSSSKARDAQVLNATKQIEESRKLIEDLKKQIANVTKLIVDLKKESAPPKDQQKAIACTPGDIVFLEDFEYTDDIVNHGWMQVSTAGPAQTQSDVVAQGSRALRLSDFSNSAPNVYTHTLPVMSGNFQVDYYLRTEQYGQAVMLALQGDQGVVDGQAKGIATELSDNVNRNFRVQDTFYFNHRLAQWYHVRLMVRPASRSFDVYVDDMDKPLAANQKFLDSLFNRMLIHTATAGTGAGYWDNIVIKCT